MAIKRTWDPNAELRALNYMVRVLIVTHPDRAKLAAAIGRATMDVEGGPDVVEQRGRAGPLAADPGSRISGADARWLPCWFRIRADSTSTRLRQCGTPPGAAGPEP